MLRVGGDEADDVRLRGHIQDGVVVIEHDDAVSSTEGFRRVQRAEEALLDDVQERDVELALEEAFVVSLLLLLRSGSRFLRGGECSDVPPSQRHSRHAAGGEGGAQLLQQFAELRDGRAVAGPLLPVVLHARPHVRMALGECDEELPEDVIDAHHAYEVGGFLGGLGVRGAERRGQDATVAQGGQGVSHRHRRRDADHLVLGAGLDIVEHVPQGVLGQELADLPLLLRRLGCHGELLGVLGGRRSAGCRAWGIGYWASVLG
mmetsp:Transcript_65195/g.205966  ORF Transcript_65195/g.205966 Transcript_65195/m.205966 type:complete len:261 (+) Transcript_65195:305-1087(+)